MAKKRFFAWSASKILMNKIETGTDVRDILDSLYENVLGTRPISIKSQRKAIQKISKKLNIPSI